MALTLLRDRATSYKDCFKKQGTVSEGRLLELIDIHTHILPGIDDGSRSLEASLELLLGAAEIGIQVVFATPHIYFYDKIRDTYAAGVRKVVQLGKSAQEKQIPVSLGLGFEIFLRPELPWLPDLEKLTLGHNGEYLLIELGLGQIPSFVEKSCFDLSLNGMTPILSHPERNLISSSQLSILERLVHQGVKLQIEAAALVGLAGKELRGACQILLQKDLVSFVASDAHNEERNFEPMQEAFFQVQRGFGQEKALQLFRENPKEIRQLKKFRLI